MMRATPIRLAATLLALFLAVACSGGSPEAAARDFYRAVEKGELDEAVDMISSGLVGQMGRDKLKAALSEATREISQKGGIEKFEFSNQEIIGQTASLDVKITYGNGNSEVETMDFIREDGQWKMTGEK